MTFRGLTEKHTIQIGGNVRVITNNRVSFRECPFDNAITNPFFFIWGEAGHVSTDFQDYLIANKPARRGGAGQSLDSNRFGAERWHGHYREILAIHGGFHLRQRWQSIGRRRAHNSRVCHTSLR